MYQLVTVRRFDGKYYNIGKETFLCEN